MTLALTLAVAIGFTLALLGSGGSIITLPVLVYAAGVPVASAVGMSQAPFFDGKARREERWLRERFSHYDDYACRVKRFIPGLY